MNHLTAKFTIFVALTAILAHAAGCACWGGSCAPNSDDPRQSQTADPIPPAAAPGMLAMNADPLPSWNEGPARDAIISFVQRAVTQGGDGYIKPAERIAVFDNDGTLWAEQPLYFQFLFTMDRVRALAPDHPEYKSLQPFRAVLDNDMAAVAHAGEAGLFSMLFSTHSGLTTDQFSAVVRQWINSARHPSRNVRYTELVYQPMLELLDYLRANDFKTYVVSGGGIEFMRVFAEEIYGIPPEQVVGSSIKTEYVELNGRPALMRQPEMNFIDDGPGKPVGIHEHIGRRPLMAFGNSDGDLQMLQWTAAGDGPRFMLIVRHDDAAREWAYDRDSRIGKLDKALDAAHAHNWTVVSMKSDWNRIFPIDLAADPRTPPGQ